MLTGEVRGNAFVIVFDDADIDSARPQKIPHEICRADAMLTKIVSLRLSARRATAEAKPNASTPLAPRPIWS
jgi:hypothetical protein